MKIYGYTKHNEKELQEMEEISFLASSEQLTAVANFLLKYADIMKKNKDFEHAHLQDEYKDWKDTFPDVIIIGQGK